MSKLSNLAIVGNPNSGKSTIFNLLTGLHQKVGNFAGVTVEKLQGSYETFQKDKVVLTDLPGAYSLHTTSSDEKILSQSLIDLNPPEPYDGIIYVADLRYIHQHLLLLTQVLDLNYNTLIVLTNMDNVGTEIAEQWQNFLSQKTNCITHCMSSRMAYSVIQLKEKLNQFIYQDKVNHNRQIFYKSPVDFIDEINSIKKYQSVRSDYHALLLTLDKSISNKIDKPVVIRQQIAETMSRYSIIDNWESQIKINQSKDSSSITRKIDNILTHPILGIGIFLFIMFLVFQLMYSWAEFPMTAIEETFSFISQSVKELLPDHWISNLITAGIIPGLAGVMVFIPQIVFLFLMLTLLEEAGYMTRVVYLLDHLLSRFGLNGRSIIGLISGAACAIPAIMSTRSIYNRKERLITSFVIPLIPCSARIPVYTALIGFVVAEEKLLGIFNLQGLVFMGLYMLGIFFALVIAYILHLFLPSTDQSFLIMQLPNYQLPQARQVFTTIWNKLKAFILEAGKIILIISIVLWFLSSFSWPGEFDRIEKEFAQNAQNNYLVDSEINNSLESIKLENSFAGKIGKLIEPAIKPLGFDWKIGISLITSFAAREVFVGTMSTIYSLGENQDEARLNAKLRSVKREDGSQFFDHKTSLSLILFYAFALQCMSTMAVMKRETGSWKIPILQFITFGLLAYLSCLAVYQLL